MKKTINEITELDLPVFKKAYELACVVHLDQKRNDGKTPYILHIVAVIENSYNMIAKAFSDDGISLIPAKRNLKFIDAILSIAALHDAIEDQPDKISYEVIANHLFTVAHSVYGVHDVYFLVANVLNGIKAITKKPKGEEMYIDYVLRVKASEYATIVKISDLTHNMSDLKPGNMLDKYSVTMHLLKDGLVLL